MISLRDKIIGESILSSTKAGKSGMLERAESWLKEHNIRNYEINDDGKFEIWEKAITLTEPIPEFVSIKKARTVILTTKDSLQGNMPEQVRELIIKDTEIDDFAPIENIPIDYLAVNNCNIKSLKHLPTECLQLNIGDNKQHFVKKDIKKLVKTKPASISTLGYYSTYFQNVLIGENDLEYIKKEAEKIEKILSKEIPELKSVGVSASKGGHFVWIRLDFLNKEDHPHNISDNSIYLDFRYTVSDSSLELSGQGHLNLTDVDKQGKYKYYALKGFSAPYIDNGGKKFRKVRLDDFNAKEITAKIIDWTKSVVKAAIEDQGGVLARK